MRSSTTKVLHKLRDIYCETEPSYSIVISKTTGARGVGLGLGLGGRSRARARARARGVGVGLGLGLGLGG